MVSSVISTQEKLKVGQQVTSAKGTVYTIEKFLGEGGQGEVYRVRGNGSYYALKWYHTNRFLKRINSEAFYKNLKRNVDAGVPKLSAGDTATQFIWPLEVIPEQLGSYGYIMKLFEPQYQNLTNIIMGRKRDEDSGLLIPLKWKSWFTLVTAALNTVRAFEILHSVGLSYQDINEGGISIDLNTGNVMICDCDNVSPDGSNLGIKGVVNYMAPEVVCGKHLPDVQTDEYSLAVMLFRLFYHYHPMTGIESVRLNSDESIDRQTADYQIYGSHPHYCLDINNPVNRPHPKFHSDIYRLIKVFPNVLLDAFQQVFTKGIEDRGSRLTCTEWRKVLLQVRDYLVLDNGMEKFFYTPANNPVPPTSRTLVYPHGHKVLCMPDKILYACHLDEYSMDFSRPVGKIISSNKPGVIGLYNKTGLPVKFSINGKESICENGKVMPLFEGMVIEFGNTKVNVI